MLKRIKVYDHISTARELVASVTGLAFLKSYVIHDRTKKCKQDAIANANEIRLVYLHSSSSGHTGPTS